MQKPYARLLVAGARSTEVWCEAKVTPRWKSPTRPFEDAYWRSAVFPKSSLVRDHDAVYEDYEPALVVSTVSGKAGAGMREDFLNPKRAFSKGL